MPYQILHSLERIKRASFRNLDLPYNFFKEPLPQKRVEDFGLDYNFKLPIQITEYLRNVSFDNDYYGMILGLKWLSFDDIVFDIIKSRDEVEDEADHYSHDHHDHDHVNENNYEYNSIPTDFVRLKHLDPYNWIPLCTDLEYSNFKIGIDLKPGPMGKVGQIITWSKEFTQDRIVLYDTLAQFLEDVASNLENINFYKLDTTEKVYQLNDGLNYFDYLCSHKLEELNHFNSYNKEVPY